MIMSAIYKRRALTHDAFISGETIHPEVKQTKKKHNNMATKSKAKKPAKKAAKKSASKKK